MQKIATAGENLKSAGDKVSSTGEKLLPASAAVTALGVAAVKTDSDFDSSMSQVAAVSGATGDDFDKLRAKAHEMGANICSYEECRGESNFPSLSDSQRFWAFRRYPCSGKL